MAMERAHGVLYGALLRDRGKLKESDLYGLLTRRVKAGAPLASADPEADAGYALLGTRARRSSDEPRRFIARCWRSSPVWRIGPGACA